MFSLQLWGQTKNASLFCFAQEQVGSAFSYKMIVKLYSQVSIALKSLVD